MTTASNNPSDHLLSTINVVDISQAHYAFNQACITSIGVAAKDIATNINISTIIQAIASGVVQPLIQRDQSVARTTQSTYTEAVFKELSVFTKDSNKVYDVVAKTEAYILRKILDVLPTIDSEDVFVESVEFSNENTMLIKTIINVYPIRL